MDQTKSFSCKICHEQKAVYTCPKCQIPYCSVKCYQHNSHEKCSEKFYEDNVVEDLQQMKASDEEKKVIMQLLKNFEQECADDEEAMLHNEKIADLASRLAGVDLDGDSQEIWMQLSEKERKEFKKIVQEQNFSNLIPEWLPWWTYKKAKKPLVVEVDAEEVEEQDDPSDFKFPKISTKIQPFSHFTKSDPPPCLKYNTLNILLAYTFVTMRYNGEHQDKELCVQCAEDFVSLSDVILHATNMHSAGEAFRQMYASLKKIDDLFISLDHLLQVVDNVVLILQGPEENFCNDFLLMAFSDMLKLISNSRNELKSDIEAAESRKQLLLVKRKLDFYSGWILSYAESSIPQVVPELLIEKGCSIMFICVLYCDWKHHSTGRENAQKNCNN
ncbi:hypothetical protein EB796_009243 [Bugula neritina]|uniref:HIT-type domain-containing protein n=1 Tax=Bugula neritina TaxID=10212 RepID=A0A7J7K1C1_BUGNE|nr:hypothetical protein EB796_009243 [Bugula neritina]